ncbi:hypothetical protein Hanom_Chr09g00771941 [Helianthus anomalus]
MFASNCRRCHLLLNLTIFVLNVSKSCTLCPLALMHVICLAHEDILVFSPFQMLLCTILL